MDLYVDYKHGDNRHSGIRQKPLRTIKKASEKATAYAMIHVVQNEIYEELDLSIDGLCLIGDFKI